jgi:hypothetical protein
MSAFFCSDKPMVDLKYKSEASFSSSKINLPNKIKYVPCPPQSLPVFDINKAVKYFKPFKRTYSKK